MGRAPSLEQEKLYEGLKRLEELLSEDRFSLSADEYAEYVELLSSSEMDLALITIADSLIEGEAEVGKPVKAYVLKLGREILARDPENRALADKMAALEASVKIRDPAAQAAIDLAWSAEHVRLDYLAGILDTERVIVWAELLSAEKGGHEDLAALAQAHDEEAPGILACLCDLSGREDHICQVRGLLGRMHRLLLHEPSRAAGFTEAIETLWHENQCSMPPDLLFMGRIRNAFLDMEKEKGLDAAVDRLIGATRMFQNLGGGEVFEVDGTDFSDRAGFAHAFSGTVLGDELEWDGNFDALDDILRGGCGSPEDGFLLVWYNSKKSKNDLADTFDVFVEIFRNHGPGGDEYGDNVELRLD